MSGQPEWLEDHMACVVAMRLLGFNLGIAGLMADQFSQGFFQGLRWGML